MFPGGNTLTPLMFAQPTIHVLRHSHVKTAIVKGQDINHDDHKNGASDGIRTHDGHLGKVELYRAELRSLKSKNLTIERNTGWIKLFKVNTDLKEAPPHPVLVGRDRRARRDATI